MKPGMKYAKWKAGVTPCWWIGGEVAKGLPDPKYVYLDLRERAILANINAGHTWESAMMQADALLARLDAGVEEEG